MSLWTVLYRTLLVLMLSYNAFASEVVCEPNRCIAVVDAGSTGSRIHLFATSPGHDKAIQIQEIWVNRIKPGIASLDANTETMKQYVHALMQAAPKQTAPVPVYFYATAGMRMLSYPKQQQVYQLLKNSFQSVSGYHLVEARTITGKEEGLFGWLAANYELGALNDTPNHDLVGVMDMGGASVQVSFPIQNTDGINAQDLVQVKVGGKNIQLFVHSFLGLGQVEVAKQFLDEPSCFMRRYPLPDGLEGDGDAVRCEGEVSSLMNAVHHVAPTLASALSSARVQEWYTIGALAELAKSQPYKIDENAAFTLRALQEIAQDSVCSQDWDDMQQRYLSNDYLYGYCLFPSYYYALVVDGYGISPDERLHYFANNQSSDWTLGVVMEQVTHSTQHNTF